MVSRSDLEADHAEGVAIVSTYIGDGFRVDRIGRLPPIFELSEVIFPSVSLLMIGGGVTATGCVSSVEVGSGTGSVA